MSRQMTVAIAGLGSRGRDTYAKAAKIYPDKMKIVAIADIDPEKVKLTAEEYDVPMSHCYESAEDMLKEEKLADAMIIATQDRQHVGQAIKALKKGYHLLLEKPISPDLGECRKISEVAKECKREKRASKREKKDWIAEYIFIAPVTLGLLVFYIWPFIQNIWFSFNEVSKFNVATFCGLANYQKVFRDGEVLKTFGNTLKYVVVTVPVGLFLSILIATLLNSKIKGTSIYRTLYFLPSVTMAAAVAMVWKWIYNEKMGILNSAIRALGGKGVGWLTDPKIALYSVMIVGLWMSVGYNMIILLAGMQGISKSYYEAAQIDGAGPVQLFFKVTIPLLTPTIFFVMITSIISGFQVFDVIYMMIGKTNPAYANTQTVVMLFYRQAFDYGYKGYAAAISILIFAAIMLVTVIQMIGQKKWVNYD